MINNIRIDLQVHITTKKILVNIVQAGIKIQIIIDGMDLISILNNLI
jgi:hypothetical protein